MQQWREEESKKEELVVFKYKREAPEDQEMDTLIFSCRPRKMLKPQNVMDKLSKKMQKMAVDEAVYCLKKIDIKREPQLQNLIFRTRDLVLQKRAQVRNDLINGLRSHNFPNSIKVCQIEDQWIPYNPSNKKKQKMEVEVEHDYYILARDVIDEYKSYQQIEKPRQLIDYIGDSEGEMNSDQGDSQDSNRQDHPDNDYPQEDYDFDEEEDQQAYGEYNPYNSGDEDCY